MPAHSRGSAFRWLTGLDNFSERQAASRLALPLMVSSVA